MASNIKDIHYEYLKDPSKIVDLTRTHVKTYKNWGGYLVNILYKACQEAMKIYKASASATALALNNFESSDKIAVLDSMVLGDVGFSIFRG